MPLQHKGSRNIGQSFFAGVHSSTFTCWISYAVGQDNPPLFRPLLFFLALLWQPSTPFPVLEETSGSPDAVMKWDSWSYELSWSRLSSGRESDSNWMLVEPTGSETDLSKPKLWHLLKIGKSRRATIWKRIVKPKSNSIQEVCGFIRAISLFSYKCFELKGGKRLRAVLSSMLYMNVW